MALVICPIVSYGGSTGLAPIHVNTISLLINDHRITFVNGVFFFLFFFSLLIIGSTNTAKDATKAITPPIFEGIERRIAYANRKYHSGWIWSGVAKGFASFEFSVSPIISGVCVVKVIKMIMAIITGVVSLIEK